jgi:hypothetical protein
MSTLAPARPRIAALPVLLMVAWLGVIFLLAATGFFVRGTEPPWRLGLAILVPLAAVALALWRSDAVRAGVRSLDLQFLTTLQAWRLAGFVFIAFSVNGLLPDSFAIPASLGDIAVALTAPLVARHLDRLPLFIGWTVFGILDLVNAVTLGVLNSAGPLGLLTDGTLTTDLTTRMPLVLIPAFGVPLMLVLHMLSLAHLRLRSR